MAAVLNGYTAMGRAKMAIGYAESATTITETHAI
jgi:hypothetical protein